MFKELFEKCLLCEAVPGDKSEVFMFMGRRFEVGDAWKLINYDPTRFKTTTINLDDLKGLMSLIGINKEHVSNISKERLKQPGILIRIPDEQFMLIDGWHRAYNLLEQDIKTMDAYLITDIEDIEAVSEETAEAIRNEST